MTWVRLNDDSFIRRYEDIGYIYDQVTRRDAVLDHVGGEFLSTVARTPVSIDRAMEQLRRAFPDVPPCELLTDYEALMQNLAEQGFISLADDKAGAYGQRDDSCRQSQPQSVADGEQDTFNSKLYLDAHFRTHPRPFRAHLELTSRCNLRCVHCYCSGEPVNCELSKSSILSFVDQLAAMGTLELIVTGGEPLLCEHCIDAISHARARDLSVFLLTNGTFLNGTMVQTLLDLRIALVQVSLYSMDEAVHDSITQVAGSWAKTMAAIDSLASGGVSLEISCPVLKDNAASFHRVINFGRRIGVGVGSELAIMAREDFSRDNLAHRVPIEDVAEIVQRRAKCGGPSGKANAVSRRFRPDDPVCGMGVSLICLSSNGVYCPCPGFALPLGHVETALLHDVWHSSEIVALRQLTNKTFNKCMKCDSLDYCNLCPAKFYNESAGDPLGVFDYYCEIAKAERALCEGA